jgi:hypothetical protein
MDSGHVSFKVSKVRIPDCRYCWKLYPRTRLIGPHFNHIRNALLGNEM